MKTKHWLLVSIIIALVFAFGGYYVGNKVTLKQVKDFYTISPESTYALLSDHLYELSDKMVLSYFMRAANMGLNQLTTDEMIIHIENKDLKVFLKQQQQYLETLREQRHALIEKNPELRVMPDVGALIPIEAEDSGMISL